MEKKLCIVMLAVLLLFPLVSGTSNILTTQNNDKETVMSPSYISSFVEVPTWESGDSWRYRFDEIVVHYDDGNVSFQLVFKINDLLITVQSVNETIYEIIISPTSIEGSFALDISNSTGYGPLNVTGELKQTSVSGRVWIGRESLGIVDIEFHLHGRIWIKVNENPYAISIPSIPFRATVDGVVHSSIPFTVISFPSDCGDTWGTPATNITFDGLVQSPWFNVTNGINNFIRNRDLFDEIAAILYLLGYPISADDLRMFSDILADVFPIVNISYVMEKYLGLENTFPFPEAPDIFHCANETEMITVPAGTFEAYNITVVGGLGSMYYAPDAGMIIKIEGRFEDVIPFITNLKGELLQTTYS